MHRLNLLSKRPLLVIALAIIAHLSMSADYALVIHKTNGVKQTVLLDKKPKMSFDETDLLINVDGNNIAIARADISNMDFTANAGNSAVTEIGGDAIQVIDSNTFRINAPAIGVYDIAGRNAAATITADSEGSVVSLTSCPSGVYIITYNNNSIKIIKK